MKPLAEKKLFLLDMDGTLYLDEELFEHVPAFLKQIRERGGRYLFLTNNSSKGLDGYLAKMKRLGIPAAEEDFLTSVDAAVFVLQKDYPGRKCYAFGTKSFRTQLKSAGIRVVTTPEEDTELLIIGYDTELTYQKLTDACLLLKKDIPYLATNPDWVCPTAFGSVPDCGSICEMLFHATGKKPRIIGKPQATMAELALARTGFSPDEAVIIGDRLYTDIACGVNAGIDSVFVLSGEGVREDIETYGIVPSYVYPSVGELYLEISKQ